MFDYQTYIKQTIDETRKREYIKETSAHLKAKSGVQTFVRYGKAVALAKGNLALAYELAEHRGWEDALSVIKAAISAQSSSDAEFISQPASVDFAAVIRANTIIGKLPTRRAIAGIRMISGTAGTTANWSGEGNPRPVSKMSFSAQTLLQLGVNAIMVVDEELVRSLSPLSEAIFAEDLVAAAVYACDSAFIDPSNAGTVGAKPAAITNGVTAVHSSGSALANTDYDLNMLQESLNDAGSDMQYAAYVMRPRTALALATLRGSGGEFAYPDLTVNGGTLLGLPCVVSNAVPSSVGSPAEGGSITLLDASEILVTDNGGSALEVSNEAAIQMSDSPSGAAQQVSMFQTGTVALKVTRYVNWARTRAGMAQVLDQVNY